MLSKWTSVKVLKSYWFVREILLQDLSPLEFQIEEKATPGCGNDFKLQKRMAGGSASHSFIHSLTLSLSHSNLVGLPLASIN